MDLNLFLSFPQILLCKLLISPNHALIAEGVLLNVTGWQVWKQFFQVNTGRFLCSLLEWRERTSLTAILLKYT
jgi:hypothetical protein